jgi:hypothetical protein
MTRWQPPHPLDELEHAVHAVKAAHDQIETQSDLDRLRRCVLLCDAIWATKSRDMEKVNGRG